MDTFKYQFDVPKKEKKVCPKCHKESIIIIEKIVQKVTVKGVNITYQADMWYCKCGAAWTDAELEKKNNNYVNSIYKHTMLCTQPPSCVKEKPKKDESVSIGFANKECVEPEIEKVPCYE